MGALLSLLLGAGSYFLGEMDMPWETSKPKRRRRRKRLTAQDIGELSHIKAILGKTAAANALPFYLGRG